ncbi:MAG: nucleoside triphosphate pyrophosphohydrolase, partial [Clostridiales bacterium]|nr:nucleoside triphosphate pyrophosphohydrolase [Clostridiales bacterium]
AQIAKEQGKFDIEDVILGVSEKMIRRHPHIFKSDNGSNSEKVSADWEDIKRKERRHNTHTQSLKDVPKALPALIRSNKIQKRAAKVGFDWDRVEDALKKLEEEVAELKVVYLEDRDAAFEELGDVLFAAVNVGRFLNIEPELALISTIEKFITRFSYIEENADNRLEDMSLEEMDKLWDRAKRLFRGQNHV